MSNQSLCLQFNEKVYSRVLCEAFKLSIIRKILELKIGKYWKAINSLAFINSISMIYPFSNNCLVLAFKFFFKYIYCRAHSKA